MTTFTEKVEELLDDQREEVFNLINSAYEDGRHDEKFTNDKPDLGPRSYQFRLQLKIAIQAEISRVLERVKQKLTSLCDYCEGKGYVEEGGMAIEDDLVTRHPCDNCDYRNKAINKIKGEYK